MTMLRWLRLLISMFLLAATLTGGWGGASAHPSHHNCVAMTMNGAPCDHDDGSTPPCNKSALCAGQQMLLPSLLIAPARIIKVVAVSFPLALTFPVGRGSLPDLRPPIA